MPSLSTPKLRNWVAWSRTQAVVLRDILRKPRRVILSCPIDSTMQRYAESLESLPIAGVGFSRLSGWILLLMGFPFLDQKWWVECPRLERPTGVKAKRRSHDGTHPPPVPVSA